MEELRQEVNDLDWQGRKMKIKIHCIQKTKNDNSFLVVNEVRQKMQVPELLKSDILALHRLPSKPDAVSDIGLRFATHRARDAWIHKQKPTKTCRWTGVPL